MKNYFYNTYITHTLYPQCCGRDRSDLAMSNTADATRGTPVVILMAFYNNNNRGAGEQNGTITQKIFYRMSKKLNELLGDIIFFIL
jgi:hypothetical protein